MRSRLPLSTPGGMVIMSCFDCCTRPRPEQEPQYSSMIWPEPWKRGGREGSALSTVAAAAECEASVADLAGWADRLLLEHAEGRPGHLRDHARAPARVAGSRLRPWLGSGALAPSSRRAAGQSASAMKMDGRIWAEAEAANTSHVVHVSRWLIRIFSSPPKTAFMKSISRSSRRSSPC